MDRLPLLAALALLLPAACATAAPRPSETVLNPAAPRWVYEPSYDWDEDDEPGVIYAAGRARIHLNLNLAEENARADALADIAAFLEVTIERMHTSLASEAGSLGEAEAIVSSFDDELFTRQLVSASLSGARLQGSWFDEHDYHVWMKYDARDAFFTQLQQQLGERLRDGGRELQEAARDRLLEQLLASVAAHNDR